MPDTFDPTMIELLVDDIGEDAARELLQLFFRDSAEKLDLLCEADAACTTRRAQRHAYALKSAAAAFGFAGLSALAQSLEVDAPALSPSEFTARTQSLSDALATARTRAPLP
jgi:HPt (histidine-containing phosphotransfer) domain-containing protein